MNTGFQTTIKGGLPVYVNIDVWGEVYEGDFSVTIHWVRKGNIGNELSEHALKGVNMKKVIDEFFEQL